MSAWKSKKPIKKSGDQLVKIKKTKIVKEKKIIEKPYNAGTQTSAAFFGMLRQSWRKLSMYWIPIAKCKEAARRPNQSSNNRLKWQYQCNRCKNWYAGNEVNVDHISQCGSLNSFEDLPEFCKKLFCEIDNLQVLCSKCHDIKGIEDKEKLKLEKENGNI